MTAEQSNCQSLFAWIREFEERIEALEKHTLTTSQEPHCSCEEFQDVVEHGQIIAPYRNSKNWILTNGGRFLKFCPWCGEPVKEP